MRGLLRCGGVAAGFYEVMRSEDLLLLLYEEFADRKGKIVIESFFVSLFGFVFALLCGLEQAMITAT
jgi:hypothetical protein